VVQNPDRQLISGDPGVWKLICVNAYGR
jgi:hypothetical protein